MRLRLTIAAIVLCGWTSAVADDGAGTQSPFTFGFGARDLALGGANVATVDFTTAPFWNPSRLARTDRLTAAAFHGRLYESDVMYQYAGLAWPTLDLGALGLGVARLGIGGIDRRDDHNVPLGMTTDNRLALYLAYARTLKGYDIGLSVSVEHHALADFSATSSPGLNVSVTRQLVPSMGWIFNPTLSLNGGNIVRPGIDLAAETVRYPGQLDGGFSFELRPGASSPHALAVSTRLSRTSGQTSRFALGMEYRLRHVLFLRGGHRDGDLSAGFGVRYKSLRFDYAAVDRELGPLHFFSITTAVGKLVVERRRIRQMEQEAEFDDYFTDRVSQFNQDLADSLIEQGQALMAGGDPDEAIQRFDRALFLARGSEIDTLPFVELLRDARSETETRARRERFDEYIDSTTAKFVATDYLGARYYANLALGELPSSIDAKRWLRQSDSALTEIAERENMLAQRLQTIDSLVDYGEIDQALLAARALNQFAPGDERVGTALRRARFEKLRAAASGHYTAGEWTPAMQMLDSALALFPGHQWCTDLRKRVVRSQAGRRVEPVKQPVRAKRPPLSADMRREVEATYKAAQDAFRRGALDEAIADWERVEQLAPDHEMVREYLVRAYRLSGVEHYGQNRLAEAVTMLQKAARLDPGNEEIRLYIERAQSEMRRLKELTFDQ